MNDHSRILLAISGLAIGPALAAGGSYLLGNARAVARYAATERRRRADLGQYAAALLALIGFLALAAGAGLLAAELMPGTETVRLVVGGVTGVLVFTIAGILFSRLADAAEDGRVRRMRASTPAAARALPALTAGPGAYAPGTASPPGTLPPAVAAAIAAQRAPSTSVPPVPAYVTPEPAAPLPASAPAATGRPAIPLPASSAGPWFEQRDEATADDSTVGDHDTADESGEPPHHDPDAGPDPATDEIGAGQHEHAADTAPGTGDGDPSPGPVVIEGPEQLREQVRPGWVYRDEADQWYLGVASDSGALLRLPEFALALPTDPRYPLVIAGAGEIAVVPVGNDGPPEHLTD